MKEIGIQKYKDISQGNFFIYNYQLFLKTAKCTDLWGGISEAVQVSTGQQITDFLPDDEVILLEKDYETWI